MTPKTSLFRLLYRKAGHGLPLPSEGSLGSRVIGALSNEWQTIEEIRGAAQVASSELAHFLYFLSLALDQTFVRVLHGSTLVCEIRPGLRHLEKILQKPTAGHWQLAPFSLLRRDGKQTILESGNTATLVALEPETVQAISPFLFGQTVQQTSNVVILAILNVLRHAGLIEPRAEATVANEDEADQLWDFHDRLFHRRSTFGGHSYPFPRVFPFGRKAGPAPVSKAPMSEEILVFPPLKPEQERLFSTPFAEVLENRASVGPKRCAPISLGELGAFFQFSLRPRKVEQGGKHAYPVSFRAAASAGGMHPLEIYAVVSRDGEGLPIGFYHYAPERHALERLPLPPIKLEALTRRTMPDWETPIVLISTARMARTAWKYHFLSMRLIMNDWGCLAQAFYLAATALKLAPSALGGSEPFLFEEITGIPANDEPQVGMFVLSKQAETE